jgi:hypothetical protein
MKSAAPLLAAALLASAARLCADPLVSSWRTNDSGQYARIYQSTAAETAGTPSTTWSRGQGVQSQPTYAGVSEISYSTNWVYIRTSGLAGHVMGPWYLDAAKSQNFPNFPANTATIFRFPRVPAVAATKTLTPGGAIGFFVNGVAFFDNRDTFSYSNSNSKDADPTAGIGLGDGIWNRDAYANEGVTFDAGLAHQAGKQYHYHVHPVALRHQLGDHVDYNAATNRYAESTQPVTRHSPIIAWAADGYPVYGPYGYATANNPSSSLRRMVSGYVKRDGQFGTVNLNSTGRRTLPAWAAAAQNRSATLSSTQYGPNISAAYAMGHYLEDYDYLGDLGYPQGGIYDLDKYNGRQCVTPEFPQGTYAYFSTIDAAGLPVFPFNIGRWYYGSPTGGSVASIAETVTIAFSGGPNKKEDVSNFALNRSSGNVVLTWSAVEGGTYQVQASPNLSTWTNLGGAAVATDDTASITDAGAALASARKYYKVSRTALAAFDSAGYNYTPPGGGGGATNPVAPGGYAPAGTTLTVLITLPTTPPQPPAGLVPTSVTLGGAIAGTSVTRPSQGTVQATFAIPAGTATGAKNIVIVFNPAPTYTMTGAFTVN